jgi:protein O-mannosyl-transferase
MSRSPRPSRAPRPSRRSGGSRTLLLAVLLAAATLASYAPTFSAGFVDIDDADYVPENEVVKAGLGADGLVWAFVDPHAGNWFPLTWISHMTDVELFGVEPRGHHAMNVALHVANALLLFLALASITGELAPSFVVAAVFALHPVNVESVAWISQRKTTLSTFFGILAIWSYARWARSGRRLAYAASLASFALSLLSKQIFVTLPFALLLLDYWPLRRRELEPPDAQQPTLRSVLRGWLRLLPEKLPYLLLAVAASVAAIVAQRDAISTGETYPLAVRLGNVAISYVRYLGSLAWPAHLAVFYPLYEDDVTLARVLGSIVLLLGITAGAWRWGRTRRFLLVGWLWFLGTLVPVIGLLQIGAQAMADRYAYVPFWGLLIALTWTGWDWIQSHRAVPSTRVAAAAGVAALFAILGISTFRQAAVWHDSIALFEAALRGGDRNYVAHRALAGQYFNRGDYTRALQHAEEGAKHPRDLGEVLPVYGMALYQTGAKARAIEVLEEATRVAPNNVMGFTNLGWIALQEGDTGRAIDALQAAVRVDPQSARAAHMLATAELRRGDLAGAATALERAVALDAQNFDARIEWARALASLQRFAEATEVLRSALDAARSFPEAQRRQLTSTLHQYLGDVHAAQNDRGGAAAEYELALADWPDNYGANRGLAALLLGADGAVRGDPARAVFLAERASALSQRRKPEALATLASAYTAAGRGADADTVAREALALARATGNRPLIASLEAQLGDLARSAQPSGERESSSRR